MSGWAPIVVRGDMFWVDLDPTRGSEATKTRPAVIVSNNGVNTTVFKKGRGVVTVVPVTSNVSYIYPFQTLILAAEHPGLRTDSKAQAEQVRTVDVSRVGNRITTLTTSTMQDLEAALCLHLGL
ncbi:type II toxin-antitoxin system PemK/MazF family toxin [Catenulispora pinisilvae]|uniref:type II toxin-antitoxin system PemK/MazF family toxin n=1 Tax=Catenulispora pinisilvae TaxID=2705253 RepID=UPI001E5A93DC|nr:type II toxin-antitoxin system PemK/MazF family toxin [Catenulispora pinisilvae]